MKRGELSHGRNAKNFHNDCVNASLKAIGERLKKQAAQRKGAASLRYSALDAVTFSVSPSVCAKQINSRRLLAARRFALSSELWALVLVALLQNSPYWLHA
jgi:hypothetical protein